MALRLLNEDFRKRLEQVQLHQKQVGNDLERYRCAMIDILHEINILNPEDSELLRARLEAIKTHATVSLTQEGR
jgi:hypothetical protein